MDNKFRTRKNLFEDHNTEWKTFEHTYHHLALECQMLGVYRVLFYSKSRSGFNDIYNKMKITFVHGRVQIT